VVVLLFGFVLGCALIVSVLHAYYRDVAPILTAALLPWFFITPIFFQLSSLLQHHPAVRALLDWVNPLAPFVQLMRGILWGGGGVTWARLLYAAVAAALALAAGRALFDRMEGELAVVL
jgi:ABC-type polysaccharide/polyol phosphate export permease